MASALTLAKSPCPDISNGLPVKGLTPVTSTKGFLEIKLSSPKASICLLNCPLLKAVMKVFSSKGSNPRLDLAVLRASIDLVASAFT